MSKTPVTLRFSLLPANFILFVFIVAKLTGWISWSWWWVFCPLWIPLVAATLGFLFTLSILLGSAVVLALGSLLGKYLK